MRPLKLIFKEKKGLDYKCHNQFELGFFAKRARAPCGAEGATSFFGALLVSFSFSLSLSDCESMTFFCLRRSLADILLRPRFLFFSCVGEERI